MSQVNTQFKEIIAEFPDARIVVISAVRSQEMIECIQLGAKSYIEKPLKFDTQEYVRDFALTVEEALGGSRG